MIVARGRTCLWPSFRFTFSVPSSSACRGVSCSFSLLTSDSRAALLDSSSSIVARGRSIRLSLSRQAQHVRLSAVPSLAHFPLGKTRSFCSQLVRISLKLNHPHNQAQNFLSPLHQAHHLSPLTLISSTSPLPPRGDPLAHLPLLQPPLELGNAIRHKKRCEIAPLVLKRRAEKFVPV